jgi:hypothetical protein
MLSIDMRGLSERQLRESVSDRCATSGITTVLRIVAPDDRHAFGAAAVKASTLDDAEDLARRLGAAHCGCNVIITLLQQGWSMAHASRQNHYFHVSAAKRREELAASDDADFDGVGGPPAF